MSWNPAIKANKAEIDRCVREKCETIINVGRYLKSVGMLDNQKTTFEKCLEGEKGAVTRIKEYLYKDLENTAYRHRGNVDWELLQRTRDERSMRTWNASDSRNPKKVKTIHYGNDATLNWLVYGSDEGLDNKDDPLLNAFMVGFQLGQAGLNTLKGVRSVKEEKRLLNNNMVEGKMAGEIKLTKHEHKVEKYLREKDIIITPRQIGKAEPRKPIEIVLDLYKCVNDIFDNVFTDKEREGFVSWFACDRSLRKAGKQLKIDPKSLHARLFGDSRGGGAIRKVRNNPRLRELAWEAGILKNLPKTPPTK